MHMDQLHTRARGQKKKKTQGEERGEENDLSIEVELGRGCRFTSGLHRSGFLLEADSSYVWNSCGCLIMTHQFSTGLHRVVASWSWTWGQSQFNNLSWQAGAFFFLKWHETDCRSVNPSLIVLALLYS